MKLKWTGWKRVKGELLLTNWNDLKKLVKENEMLSTPADIYKGFILFCQQTGHDVIWDEAGCEIGSQKIHIRKEVYGAWRNGLSKEQRRKIVREFRLLEVELIETTIKDLKRKIKDLEKERKENEKNNK